MKVLGVNGGNGVILHPFKEDLIGNVEPRAVFHTKGSHQWKLNFGDIPITRDLSQFEDERPDLIIGGPDCGHSSILSYSRAKKLSDPKENASVKLFIKALKKFQPRMFMMENLPQFLDSFPQFVPFLEKRYKLLIFKKPVSYWGNSQVNRKRLVIIGVKIGEPAGRIVKEIEKVESIFRNKNLSTSGELLRGLEEWDDTICNVVEEKDHKLPLYYKDRRNMSVLEAELLWKSVFKGKSRWEVNHERMKNQPGVYRNLEHEFPMTVRKSSRQFNHLGLLLSPRAMARIQGVPDDFKLWYDPAQRLYCINKARATCTKTPPYEMGVWLKTIIQNSKF